MPKKIHFFLLLLATIATITSCKQDILPKPKGYLSLEYPQPIYQQYPNNCPFNFSYNTIAKINATPNCSYQIQYPSLKATVYLSYKPVQNNLNLLLKDAQKLTYKHVIKADGITEQPYVNNAKKTYGMFYEVGGNAASQSQFYLTDSTRNFLEGSVYFYAKPNYDSILPAAHYIKNDLRMLMETLEWK